MGEQRQQPVHHRQPNAGKTVREICQEKKVLPEAELNRALDPVAMTDPGSEGSSGG